MDNPAEKALQNLLTGSASNEDVELLKQKLAQAFHSLEKCERRDLLQRRIIAGTLALVLVLLGVSVYFWQALVSQEKLTIEQARIARARELAAQAQALKMNNYKFIIRSGLLGVESAKLGGGFQADQALRRYLALADLPVARMIHDDWVSFIVFSPDGKYIISRSGNTARVWETQTGREVARMTTQGGWVTSAAFSPDGKYVVSGGCDKLDGVICVQGSARVWEAQTGREVMHKTHNNIVNSVAFSRDGKYVVSGSGDNTARVWETQTGYEVASVTHDGGVTFVAFSPDRKYIISISGKTVWVWETQTGREVAHMKHDDYGISIAISPDGKHVVSGNWDNIVRVWETQTGREVVRMKHDAWVSSVAISPDGKHVVSGSWDNTARVWETQTGYEVARMTHDDIVNSVAFSPDGEYVVSDSVDKTARVWETQTGREVARMTDNICLTLVAFSPDWKYAASVSDKTVQVWYWRLDDLVSETCRRLPRNFTRAEWAHFGFTEPYRATCPNLPIEPEPTATPTP